ncbi:hypothetical protein Poli38472_004952 [Pythium oligandrum]|uniref:Uncharacterized protein n=1 Tax=Pythium oligandrum TaxID=41045 RepID=A0A8K1CBD8_PYTOL|nr:hypothetical protein Poli38472_004952 [Pythium oligandrum]|eukprot:TMW59883.1 hypothetical protein Poli38472_004952 [Pythium oligandrum]
MPETRVPLKNPSRERMQAELRQLRVLARDLEQERDALLSKTNAAAPENDEYSHDAVKYEVELRRQAEALNKQLRERLDAQIEVVHRLKEVVDHQVSRAKGAQAALPLCQTRLDPDLFNTFINDIHVGYSMTDSIVNTINWEDETDMRGWKVDTRSSEYNGRSQMVLETQRQFTNLSCPFVRGEGDSKSWKLIIRYFQSLHFKVEELVIQENSVAARYHRMYSYRGRDIQVYLNFMMKRFVEADREVRIWRSRVTGGDDHDAAFVDVAGWMTVQPIEHGNITRLCAHLVPRIFETDEETPMDGVISPHLSDLVSYVLNSMQTEISHANEELGSQ